MIKIRVKWSGGMAFNTVTDTNHRVIMDSSIDQGGAGKAPTPMELVLTALGGCTGMDIVTILEKMGVEFSNLEIELCGERRKEPPMVYSVIDIKYVIRGKAIPDNKVRRAIELSKKKYCSVSAMLSESCDIRYTYQIIEEV